MGSKNNDYYFIDSHMPHIFSLYFNFAYFIKTLPRSSLQTHLISARFYEMGDILTFRFLNNSIFGFYYNELSQKNRFQPVPIAALCLYNIQRENQIRPICSNKLKIEDSGCFWVINLGWNEKRRKVPWEEFSCSTRLKI